MVFCCGGTQTEEDKKSAEINKQIQMDKKRLDNEVKLLLLGIKKKILRNFSVFFFNFKKKIRRWRIW